LIASSKFPHEVDLNVGKVEQMRQGKFAVRLR